MPVLNIKEYDELGPDGLAPLEPEIRTQPALTLGSAAVRSLQFSPTTRYVRLVSDARSRIRFGDSTVIADVNSQPQAADVAIDYPVANATPLYVSGVLALAPDAPNNTVPPAITGTQTVGQVLTCSNGSWVGAATITFAFQWQRDGVNIAGQTAATHTIVAADVGTVLRCVVTASNPSGAISATSNSVQIAPGNTVPPAITGTAAVGQTLTCSQGTWAGTTPSYSYQWKRGGVDIPGATQASYTLTSADLGQTLTCAVTASNGAAQTTANTSATAAVLATPVTPANVGLPVVSGVRAVGQTLTCSQGTWSGSPAPTFAYQWLRNGTPIVGATAATRLVDTSDAVADMTCQVTASNASGSAAVISASASPTIPINSGAPVVMGNPVQGEVLAVSNGTWNSVGPLSYGYQWKRDGANIGGSTAQSYQLGTPDRGTVITCQVTATNGAGSASATSAATPPVKGLPVNTTPPAVTGTAAIGQVLSVSSGSWTGLPAPTFRYQWKRGGNQIWNGRDSSYIPTAEDTGWTLTCDVTAVNEIGAVVATSNATAAVV